MQALGTEVRIVGRGAESAERELLRLASILTRFEPSPLTTLNRDGMLDAPPSELVDALRWALEAAALSGDLVTPLVGPMMAWHGYARSWPDVSARRHGLPPAVASSAAVLVRDDRIELPAGAALDLGGTGKAWIAERVATLLDGPFVVDAGGDVWLDDPEGAEVDVDAAPGGDPWHLRLPPGRWGVATSSVLRRAWSGAHHLIDPRTRRPSEGRWVQATAVARSLRHAEVATKLVLLGAPVPPTLATAGLWAWDHEGRTFRPIPGGWADAHANVANAA